MICLAEVVAPGEYGHIARPQHSRSRVVQYHSHDFAELFWVNAGTARHVINGRREPLAAGDFRCLRPEDAHTFETVGPESLTITNVAFPAEALDWLRDRYLGGETRWFWRPRDENPPPDRLDASTVHSLDAAADRLALAPRDRLHFEHFLLGVFAELRAREQHDSEAVAAERQGGSSPVPDWLAEACRGIRAPELMREGLPAFFRLAARSPEHVARAMRGAFDITPSEYLNRRRIAHAAYQLRMTARPVTEIAMDVGYENLSHFFHVFRRIHGMSPRRYRERMMSMEGRASQVSLRTPISRYLPRSQCASDRAVDKYQTWDGNPR